MARTSKPRSSIARDAIYRRSILAYFANEPYLHAVVDKLLAADVLVVEDLTSMTADQIRALIKTTTKNEVRFFDKLRSDGIEFRRSAA